MSLSSWNKKNKRLATFLNEIAESPHIRKTATMGVIFRVSMSQPETTVEGAKRRHEMLTDYRDGFVQLLDSYIENMVKRRDASSSTCTSAKLQYDISHARALRVYIVRGARCTT